MNYKNFASAALGAVLLGSVSFISLAQADGMDKPPMEATPLDQAIDQIQNKEPPVAVTPEPQPVIEQTPPPAPVGPPAPVPASRVVEVQPNTSFFGLSIGAYDATHGHMGAGFNLEWQPGVRIVGILQPLFGAMVTTRGATLAYGGLGAPFHIGKHIFVMPSFSVGAYGHGKGYDLGQVLAFRAGAEIGYEFDDKSRIGVSFAGIGNGHSFARKNRTEVISLVYTIPFSLLSGKPKAIQSVSAPVLAPAADAQPIAPMPADKAVDMGLKK